jgi:hypothetical protein
MQDVDGRDKPGHDAKTAEIRKFSSFRGDATASNPESRDSGSVRFAARPE